MTTGEWDPYFSILAGAAAALAGLVFVAFSRSADRWRRDPLLNIIGATTVGEFLVAVMVSLAQLMPHNQGRYAAIAVGTGGQVLVAWYHIAYRNAVHRRRYWTTRQFLLRQRWLSILSILAYGALIAGGITPPHVGRYLIAWACFWLLLSGSSEAWYFMDVGLDRPRPPRSPLRPTWLQFRRTSGRVRPQAEPGALDPADVL